MFIENASSAMRTPAGCYVRHRLVQRERTTNIAPRWGAAAKSAHLYKHRTPLGCRDLARQGFA